MRQAAFPPSGAICALVTQGAYSITLSHLLLSRQSRFGGNFPGRSSADGGIEEFWLFRPSRRLRSATSARSSSTARASSPISSSRASHDEHPMAGGGSSVTDRHDPDIQAVIKLTR
jgi:hypothetical protein